MTGRDPLGQQPLIDITRPSPARVYDYLLGGTDNFPADRELAEQLLDPKAGYPGLRAMARENRAFIIKAVTWLSGRDIRQFLDLGAGLPARPGVHVTARANVRDARVVYVDADAYAVWHASARLDRAAGVAVIRGDLRKPEAILADEAVRGILDLTRPVGVILGAVLHFSDAPEAAGIVEGYASALAPGSAVVVTAGWYEDEIHARLAKLSPMPWFNHSPAVVQGWFDGAGLRLMRGQVADASSWPMLPGERRRDAAVVLGGIGIRRANTERLGSRQ